MRRVARRDRDQLADAGLDEVVVVPFTRELAATSPESFMQWLQERTGLHELWVGEEFALGKDRVGTIDRLQEIGEQLGFRVIAVPRLTNGTEVVSSSRVRQAVASGDVILARRLLGRPFRVEGEVVHGQKLGRTIGFPTANISVTADRAMPALGVYATRAHIGSRTLMGATNIGRRPTFDAGHVSIETYLLDFEGDIYGERMDLEILARVRGEVRFESVAQLKAQIAKDVDSARNLVP